MRAKHLLALALLPLILLAGQAARADDAAMLRAIKSKVAAAARILAEQGPAGLEQFNDPDSEWNRTSYIFVFDNKGVILAHGGDQALIGKTLKGITDIKGNRFIVDSIKIINGPGHGWSEYWWYDKPDGKHSHKLSYIMRAPGREMGVGAGVYSPITAAEATKLVGP